MWNSVKFSFLIACEENIFSCMCWPFEFSLNWMHMPFTHFCFGLSFSHLFIVIFVVFVFFFNVVWILILCNMFFKTQSSFFYLVYGVFRYLSVFFFLICVTDLFKKSLPSQVLYCFPSGVLNLSTSSAHVFRFLIHSEFIAVYSMKQRNHLFFFFWQTARLIVPAPCQPYYQFIICIWSISIF